MAFDPNDTSTDTLGEALDFVDDTLGCAICPGDTRTMGEALDDIDDTLGCLDCPPSTSDPTVCGSKCSGSNQYMPEEISLSMSGWKWTTDDEYINASTPTFSHSPWMNNSSFASFCSGSVAWDAMYPQNTDIGDDLDTLLNNPITLTKTSAWETYAGNDYDCRRSFYQLIGENGMTVVKNGSTYFQYPFWMAVFIHLTKWGPVTNGDEAWQLWVQVNTYFGSAYRSTVDPAFTDPSYTGSMCDYFAPAEIDFDDPTYGYASDLDTVYYPAASDDYIRRIVWYFGDTKDCYANASFTSADFYDPLTLNEGDGTDAGDPITDHPTDVSGSISTTETIPAADADSDRDGPYIDDTLDLDGMLDSVEAALSCTTC